MSKVTIAGDANGTGVFTIAAPNGNTNRTLTLPDEAGTVLTTAGVPSSAMPAGSVLQVVSTTKTDTETKTNTTYEDVSGLSLSITPTNASSKILVLVTAMINPGNARGVQWQLVRDTTDIAVNTASNPSTGGNYSSEATNAGGTWVGTSVNHLDSPSTISEVTYKIQSRIASAGTYGINRRAVANDFGGVSAITLMEISA
jgi:hypothetical protein